MQLLVLSYYQFKILSADLKESGTLKSLSKRLKNKTVTARIEGDNLFFTSGHKKFAVSMILSDQDREKVERMLPRISKEITSVSEMGDGTIITF